VKTNIILIVLILSLLIFIYIKRKRVGEYYDQGKQILSNTVESITDKTWDKITDGRITTLHPKVLPRVKEFINEAFKQGYKLRVTSGFRSYNEQTVLYSQGRTAAGNIVTNAKAGESSHNFGTAIDVVEIKDGKALWTNPNWNKIAQIAKQFGFSWGGDWVSFKDMPHFEMNFGKSLTQLKQLYDSGQTTLGYVNI